MKKKTEDGRAVACQETDTIEADFNDVLTFLQAVVVKALRVADASPSLRAVKRVSECFRRWSSHHLVPLTNPSTAAQQEQLGLMVVLSNAITRLQNAEALLQDVAAQRKANREMKGWDCLPTTAKRTILEDSASDGLNNPSAPPQSLHRFLNARNATDLQADFDLTYVGPNLYLPEYFRQDLLQGHILETPQPRRSHRSVLPPHTYSIGWPSELIAECDAGKGHI